MAISDDDRHVDFLDDDILIIPDQTSDESNTGWGEDLAQTLDKSSRSAGKNKKTDPRTLSARDRELMDDRPPHWA